MIFALQTLDVWDAVRSRQHSLDRQFVKIAEKFENRLQIHSDLWPLLRRVTQLKFTARGAASTGWTGTGDGVVQVAEPTADTLIFSEAGTWRSLAGKTFKFSNIYRWIMENNAIRLEHLRFGADKPVFLFELVPADDGRWVSRTPHVCSEDCYAATLHVVGQCISVSWSITGPQKNETIAYRYW